MMLISALPIARLLILLSMLALLGCASPKAAHLDPQFASYAVRTIALMPTVDRRLDRSFEVDLDHELQNLAREQLEKKGYRVLQLRRFGQHDPISAAEVADMEPEQLRSLVPQDVDAAVILYVDDILDEYKGIYFRFKIEATAKLVSAAGGTIWIGKGVGSWGETGLLSVVGKGVNRDLAYVTCVASLFSSLPKSN